LPVAIFICAFGMTLTSVSHASEAELNDFCVEYNEDGVEGMTPQEEGVAMFRDLVDEVDTKVGIIVSTTMCSTLCPCDLEFDEDKAEEK